MYRLKLRRLNLCAAYFLVMQARDLYRPNLPRLVAWPVSHLTWGGGSRVCIVIGLAAKVVALILWSLIGPLGARFAS